MASQRKTAKLHALEAIHNQNQSFAFLRGIAMGYSAVSFGHAPTTPEYPHYLTAQSALEAAAALDRTVGVYHQYEKEIDKLRDRIEALTPLRERLWRKEVLIATRIRNARRALKGELK